MLAAASAGAAAVVDDDEAAGADDSRSVFGRLVDRLVAPRFTRSPETRARSRDRASDC